ncbi:MAG: hypothetical protein WCH30_03560 [Chlorobiaceae bacterium]
MLRFIDNDLQRWQEGTRRKPLILRGARQVGKTWSMWQSTGLFRPPIRRSSRAKDHLPAALQRFCCLRYSSHRSITVIKRQIGQVNIDR